jgi:hypothetical protein
MKLLFSNGSSIALGLFHNLESKINTEYLSIIGFYGMPIWVFIGALMGSLILMLGGVAFGGLILGWLYRLDYYYRTR